MTLSGGERQRAWIAMALAQKTDILVLDEPTTYLDISYQMEVLELVKELNETLGISIVMVLHDLNQAIRYSDRIYVLKDGEVFDHGDPCEVINRDLLKDVFNIQADIYEDLKNECPYIIPNKIER
jgi:iron complex transport system ATP-binding protein